MNSEIFHVEDENGVWLVGSSEDGLLIPDASILAGSEHLGFAILRPDDSVDEIEHPRSGTNPMVERANGELCGTRFGGGGTFLYCATPAGVVREALVEGGSITDLSVSPIPITHL